VHIYVYVPCSKVLLWIFFLKSLRYLYEVVLTNFSADFWTFHNFWPQFPENCGAMQLATETGNIDYWPSERAMTSWKRWKLHQNRLIKHDTIVAQTMSLSREERSGLAAWQTKSYKHHIFELTAGARCTVFPKLCMVIELVENFGLPKPLCSRLRPDVRDRLQTDVRRQTKASLNALAY